MTGSARAAAPGRPTPAGAPAFTPWQADPGWDAIDLVSDLHLSDATPGTWAAFRDYLLGTRADAVLVLGDLFEVWVGDEDRSDGLGRQCVDLLNQATRERVVAFMPGNRDFLFAPKALDESGVLALDDPTLAVAFGLRVVLTHGDRLCLSDTGYQRFRAEVRGAGWQAAFLARPLAERRALARAMRDASREHQATLGPASWHDADASEASRWMRLADADAMVHGHTHRPGAHVAVDGCVRHVLGDWDFDTAPARARILRWTREGLHPIDLAEQ